MFFVYILQSLKDRKTYVGQTDNIEKRIKLHNAGLVKSTKHRVPFKLLLLEKFSTRAEAMKRESWWKSSVGRKKLHNTFFAK